MRSASLVLALAVVVLAWLAPTTADACSCGFGRDAYKRRTIRWSAGQSDAVFTGKVRSTTVVEKKLVAVFEVRRVWVGEPAKQVTVATPVSGPACGLGFTAGQSYVVFARADEHGQLGAGNCSYSGELRHSRRILTALGPSSHPPRIGGRGCAITREDAPAAPLALLLMLALRRRRPIL